MAHLRPGDYKPYETTTLDTPVVHFILEPFLPVVQPFLRALYGIRALLSRPLSFGIMPKCFPSLPIPGLKWIPNVTFGEVLLTIPVAILVLEGYSLTFISPDLVGSGDVAGYAILLAFLTANKSNAITSFLLGISFERMIPYHYLSAVVAVTLGCFHTYVAFVYGEDGSGVGAGSHSRDRRLSGDSQYAKTGLHPDFVKFSFDGGTNTSGSLLVLSLAGLTILSIFPIVRRYFFDCWLWTHILLAICVIVFCFMHSVSSIIIVAIWWGVDVVVRYLVMAGCRYPTCASIRELRQGVVEISFPKPDSFEYNAGQFVQIAVPRLSPIAFHPISISSAPHEENVTLHIRALGGWTRRLIKLVQKQNSVCILLEGPYGISRVDLDDDKRYKMVLLVSGGIGVTHCQSVGKALLHDHCKRGRNLKKLQFVWAVRDIEMVQDMPPLHDEVIMSQPEQVPPLNTNGQESAPVDEYSGSAVVQADIFLTKGSSNDSENPLDLTHPSYYTLHTGRPDLDNIFAAMKETAMHEGETNVAVCGCGPEALLHQLKEACRKHSQSTLGCGGVDFDLHTATFEF